MLLYRHKKKWLKVSKDRISFKFIPSLGTSIDIKFAYQIKTNLVILFQNIKVLFLMVEKLDTNNVGKSIKHSKS